MGAVFMAVECRVVDGPSGRMLQYGGGGRDTHQLPLTPHPCLAGTLAPFLSTSVHCRHHCRCHSVYSSNHHYAPPPPPSTHTPRLPQPLCVSPTWRYHPPISLSADSRLGTVRQGWELLAVCVDLLGERSVPPPPHHVALCVCVL